MIDLEQNLIYRRLPIATQPVGGFVYVLHIPDTNYVEYGLGWESANGLQRKHVTTKTIHELECYAESNSIHKSLTFKLAGSLAQIFAGDASVTSYALSDEGPLREAYEKGFLEGGGDLAQYTPLPRVCEWVAEAIREVHDEAWGNPLAFEPQIVELGDGRLVWCLYDDDADRIRLGLGMIDDNDEKVLGDNSYILSKDQVAPYVTKIWRGQAIFFFSVPPRWPFREMSNSIDDITSLRAVAAALIKLSDKVWPRAVQAID